MQKVRSSIAAVLAAGLMATSFDPGAAQTADRAAAPPTSKFAIAAAANGGTETWDLSARRRHRGNAAALAAVVGVFGTIAALAAADRHRRDRYYYGRPYYGPTYHYGPVYRHRYRHRHWHRHW